MAKNYRPIQKANDEEGINICNIYIVIYKVISFLTHKEFLKPEEKKKQSKTKNNGEIRKEIFHACMYVLSLSHIQLFATRGM